MPNIYVPLPLQPYNQRDLHNIDLRAVFRGELKDAEGDLGAGFGVEVDRGVEGAAGAGAGVLLRRRSARRSMTNPRSGPRNRRRANSPAGSGDSR